jgi:CRP/FNR family transcriptional regulator, cyclic AMP receptor protein
MNEGKKDEQLTSKMRDIVTFRFLSDEELEGIMEIAHFARYDDGETIVAEGELSPFFYAVVEGTVNVTVRERSGNDVFICAIGEGEVFGEAGIFLKVKRTANVNAAGPAVVLQIDRNDMVRFIKTRNKAGIKILMLVVYSLLKKLRDANQELAYERKFDVDQDEIDSIVSDFMEG